MLKYTLVLAATAVTIANGHPVKLTFDDVKEIKETCEGAIDDLKTLKDAEAAKHAQKHGFGSGVGYASGSGAPACERWCGYRKLDCTMYKAECGGCQMCERTEREDWSGFTVDSGATVCESWCQSHFHCEYYTWGCGGCLPCTNHLGFGSAFGYYEGSGLGSGYGSGYDEDCKDRWSTCQGQEHRCDEFDVQDQCPLTCGVCTPTAVQIARTKAEAKECHDLLKDKCGNLSDYDSILGADLELISTAAPLTDIETREGCGFEEGVLRAAGIEGTEPPVGSGNTGSGDAKADPTAALVGVCVGLLALGGVGLGCYYYGKLRTWTETPESNVCQFQECQMTNDC